MGCPLCRADAFHASWLGALSYRGTTYPYVECDQCHSLYARPMPDIAALQQMYGPDYQPGKTDDYARMDDPKEPERVVRWLKTRPPGLFVDYGCGDGRLLREVVRQGWRAIGVEFDPNVAASTAARVGVPVANRFTLDETFSNEKADVLHLGDVVEHLTDPDAEMERILAVLKPTGFLMAQGPLEANTTLFTLALRTAKQVRRSRVSDMAPYHVMLATANGQKTLFQRLGLSTVEFSISEVDWPAPSRVDVRDLLRPRSLGLYALRRVSRAFSERLNTDWGNRYFYVGRRG